MSRLTPAQLVFIARQHFHAGRLTAAEDLCRKVLSDGPARADALQLAGLIADRAGRHDAAWEFLRRAVALAPDDPALQADLGRIYRQSGKVDDAVEAFGEALRLAPREFDVLCDLAGALSDQGEFAAAAEACRAALEVRPEAIDIRIRLGELLLGAGRPTEAAIAFEHAVAARPDDPAIHVKLGSALQLAGRHGEAIDAFRAAAALDPHGPEPMDRLGAALHRAGRPDEATACFEQAIARRPAYVPAHVHLGDCLLEMGLPDPALDAYRRALALRPADSAIAAQLAAALPDESLLEEAIAECRAATARRPGDAQAFCNLGVAYYRRRNLDAALRAYRQALGLNPAHAAATNNLGLTLKDAGQIDEAIGCLRKVVELNPRRSECHSNLLYLLHFDPDCDAAALQREHAVWRQRHADSLKDCLRVHDNDPSPERRLRIGYVSPNFRQHSVGRFLTALFDNHDHERFEIVAYSSVRRPDAITARLRRRCDRWVDATRLSDEALAEQVRVDRIDVLVDLTMHMADSRLLTFARKPAPVQVTYLAYCSLTGLDTIDYRLTDLYLDPQPDVLPRPGLPRRTGDGVTLFPGGPPFSPSPGTPGEGWGEGLAFGSEEKTLTPSPPARSRSTGRGSEFFGSQNRAPHPAAEVVGATRTPSQNPPPAEYWERGPEAIRDSEEPLPLPRSYWCYDPGIATPDVNPLPALSRGYVSFASLNNFCKASPAALELWARILRAVPSARLLLHAWPGDHRERVRGLFASEGVDAGRLRFFDMLSLPQYFALHHAIDVALDPFPYPGGTTTCDALWMGVPTVSLVGRSPFMRSGLSILSNAALPELAVDSPGRYLETTMALAGDLPRLAQLRSTMRDRLRESPLMDGARFARDVEAAYRSIWRRWCGPQ
jgi:predicted O-linked N-acetylglucosamine transferase (SPINDLY family)